MCRPPKRKLGSFVQWYSHKFPSLWNWFCTVWFGIVYSSIFASNPDSYFYTFKGWKESDSRKLSWFLKCWHKTKGIQGKPGLYRTLVCRELQYVLINMAIRYQLLCRLRSMRHFLTNTIFAVSSYIKNISVSSKLT